eukprot:TRINITY_DN9729_c0_g4_i6.p1 TRINITY_DN9729_c0_g4~~TRINITY_DN9729_c0_g4_i6.p1  ORF type:complete len:160 (+),score=32.78 TRINITY_DN9729_c0_g4_i6:536-1015(+)
MDSTNITNISLLHMLPLMETHFQKKMYSTMQKKSKASPENIILPKLIRELPQIGDLLVWKEAIVIAVITLMLSGIAHSPWFEILGLLEILYYFNTVKSNYQQAYNQLLRKYGIDEEVKRVVNKESKRSKDSKIKTLVKALVFSFHSDYIERYLNNQRHN